MIDGCSNIGDDYFVVLFIFGGIIFVSGAIFINKKRKTIEEKMVRGGAE